MEYVDTHCHIQFGDYPLEPEAVLDNARSSGVKRMIAVGCTLPDSQAAIPFAEAHEGVFASVGLHPHEGVRYVHDHHALQQFHDLLVNHAANGRPEGTRKVVAIGETGLDYYYEHSPKDDQKKLLRFQLDLAVEFNLPVIFHIRDAFDDFWPILDSYKGVRGVIHSFTSDRADLEQILSRGLSVGLNGIMTFTKRTEQLEAAKAVPLDRLVLETDAPYLTPAPFRGTICEPKHVVDVAAFLADIRGENPHDLAKATTDNAVRLFGLV